MAAKWQQWMPRYIDKWRGSPAVRAMHPSARDGYSELLSSQWQSEDGTIPSDPMELAELSWLGDELWAQYGPRILRNFEEISPGRLRNAVCHEEWLKAKAKFEANSKSKADAGKRGADARWKHGKQMAGAKKNDGEKCHTGTLTGTGTEEQKQKPSRRQAASGDMKHSSDPRHVACKERIFEAYKYKNNGAIPDWDGREGKALGMLLKANPELNEESINPLLAHWARSDINHSDRPSIWIPKLSSFRMGAVDRFGKPKEGLGGTSKQGTTTASPAKQRIDATRKALAEAAIKRGWFDPNGGNGEAGTEIPDPGHIGVPGRVSGGHGAVGVEAWPASGVGCNVGAENRPAPDILPPAR